MLESILLVLGAGAMVLATESEMQRRLRRRSGIWKKQEGHVGEICFLKLKSLSNDGVMLWVMMFVGKKWVSLLHCLDVPIIIKSVLCILSQVYYLSSSQSKSPSCVRERFVCVVYKYMYSWVLYAYKWWYNLWFWIR